MKKILVILILIGISLISVASYIDYKDNNIKNDLISNYENNSSIDNFIEKENDNIENKVSNKFEYKEETINSKRTNVIGILEIKSIGLKAPIVLGEENLDYVVAKYRSSANFGQAGNVILAGHNNMKGSIFKNLYKVKIGDIIEIKTDNNIYKYKLTERVIVNPSDSSLLTQDISKKEITLITCINRAKERLILKGKII
ncbi:class D sortase (plasmid) [Clostridium perfringens]|uniref:Sortase n=1 Tax=Clostridium perfringens TaxID=1502 RepID=A0A2X2YG37_CLOPF|nr:class D sortase [Clostridium perfringens]EDS79318.1 sortase family protein [Clostridium perfringens C str. JGS1495]ELC8423050.1 class D sortase [Clostridium perfringens]ELC8450884.1 class D sortase [Clostridium perfringens]MBI6029741.1 class D sortase [Clostridium perfringens]MBI6033128.1 class D sortase [Clostridium perfringens]